jgi:hypothetical protein
MQHVSHSCSAAAGLLEGGPRMLVHRCWMLCARLLPSPCVATAAKALLPLTSHLSTCCVPVCV